VISTPVQPESLIPAFTPQSGGAFRGRTGISGSQHIMAKNKPVQLCTTGIPETPSQGREHACKTLYNRDPKKDTKLSTCVCVHLLSCHIVSSSATLLLLLSQSSHSLCIEYNLQPGQANWQQQEHTYGLQKHSSLNHAPQIFQSLPDQHPSTCTTPISCKLMVLPIYIACL